MRLQLMLTARAHLGQKIFQYQQRGPLSKAELFQRNVAQEKFGFGKQPGPHYLFQERYESISVRTEMSGQNQLPDIEHKEQMNKCPAEKPSRLFDHGNRVGLPALDPPEQLTQTAEDLLLIRDGACR